MEAALVGEVGIEPTTNRLRAECSTTELLTQKQILVYMCFRRKFLPPCPLHLDKGPNIGCCQWIHVFWWKW